jgi:exopolysaccharide biosynthesis polyprenyl glycosylphosphotransferase
MELYMILNVNMRLVLVKLSVDAVISFFSLLLALLLFDCYTPEGLKQGLVVVTLYTLSMVSLGLYESKTRLTGGGVLKRLILSASVAFMLSLLMLILFGHHVLQDVMISCATLMVVSHFLIRKSSGYLRLTSNKKQTVVIIGAGDRAALIHSKMKRAADRSRFSKWTFLSTSGPTKMGGENVIDISNQSELIANIETLSPSVIVLSNENHEQIPFDVLLSKKISGCRIVGIEQFVAEELSFIFPDESRIDWLLCNNGFKPRRGVLRVIDYCFNSILAIIVATLAFPVMILASLIIYFDDGRRDGASIFYRQDRVGEHGGTFSIIKFRSMRKNAESNGAQWSTSGDVRVTNVGRYLRKYRIDELPQLWNILKGDMNFVGPRPERPGFVDLLSKKNKLFKFRHEVKPGLTGWAQIKYPYGENENDSMEKLSFDLFYIRDRSFLGDLFILMRTVEVVIFGQGR